MEHITYLLGAGASRKCLPIVSEMTDKINEITATFQQIFNIQKSKLGTAYQEQGTLLIKDLQWLAKVCDIKKNFSVDTFAKKLKLSNNEAEYHRLNNILTVYFTLQQKFKTPDIRYDNFWASLLNEKDRFPNNIKILSWNYDFQMELTYQDFCGSSSLIETAKRLNIVTHKTATDDTQIDKFTVFKLNGSATYNSEAIERGNQYIVDTIKDCSKEDTIDQAIDYFSKCHPKGVMSLYTHLSYAWEHNKESVFYKKLEGSLEHTSILIVIGYSFPYFNREVDKLLLNKYMPNLQKVYFQDEVPDSVKERFRAVNPGINIHQLISIHDTYQFYFPNEL